ncbi:MAG: Coq4 family protein [Candidatus Azotimanducaceae bacterium]|jgi:ubiquinone biosynthesis protein COQ4
MKTTLASSPPKRPIEWRNAFSAMRRLIKNPDATDEVFTIIEALSGNSLQKGFSRFVTTDLGREILVDRRSLLETLLNREYLATLPQHSLAAHYLNFVTKENIRAEGLVAPSEGMRAMKNLDADTLLFANRQRDMHDLWHTLTHYGRDELGEVCLLAFTCAQSPNRGLAFIALVGIFQLSKRYGRGVYGAAYRAYQDGKKAAWLPAQDWESLLTQPIGAVRAQLNIHPPQRYQDLQRLDLLAST